MKMSSIVSGSSGNCILVGTNRCNVLVDAGTSKKKIELGLVENNIDPHDIDGIFITHEHSDHISGLGVFTRKYPVPIYGTKETLFAVKQAKSLGAIDKELFCEIEPDESYTIKDLSIKPFKISHDALNPVAYRLEYENQAVAIATDMGTFDDYTIEKLKNLDAVLLEANHDVNMLQVGPYPYPLKQRILGDRGHLSNEMSARLLIEILHDNIKKIFLGHLSKENNYAELAYETVRAEIAVSDNLYKAADFNIEVAGRSEVSALFEF